MNGGRKSRAVEKDTKKGKISALKQQQMRWMSDMHSNHAAATTPEIPTKLPPQIPNGFSAKDILADNWYGLAKASNDSKSSISCPKCKLGMKSPHLVIPCGHSCCETCLVQDSTVCPVCHNPIQGHCLNLALQQLIQSQSNQEPMLQAGIEIVSGMASLDFDQDPSELASKYKNQLDQLKDRCKLLQGELKQATAVLVSNQKKIECISQVETSNAIVRSSTREMNESQEKVLELQQSISSLNELVHEHRQIVTAVELALEEHTQKELLVKETLDSLLQRKEKVQAIWKGLVQ